MTLIILGESAEDAAGGSDMAAALCDGGEALTEVYRAGSLYTMCHTGALRLSGGAGAAQAALTALPHSTASPLRHRTALWDRAASSHGAPRRCV